MIKIGPPNIRKPWHLSYTAFRFDCWKTALGFFALSNRYKKIFKNWRFFYIGNGWIDTEWAISDPCLSVICWINGNGFGDIGIYWILCLCVVVMSCGYIYYVYTKEHLFFIPPCFPNCVENMYHSVKHNTTLRTSLRNSKLIKFIFVKFKMFFRYKC